MENGKWLYVSDSLDISRPSTLLIIIIHIIIIHVIHIIIIIIIVVITLRG